MKDIEFIEKEKRSPAAETKRIANAQVANALWSKRLSELQSERAREIYDDLVIEWLLGRLPPIKDQRTLERLVLEQPVVVGSVEQLRQLIRLRQSTAKEATRMVSTRLQRTAGRCLSYWMRLLFVEAHRPTDRESLERMAKAARMRDGNIPWPRILQELSPATKDTSVAIKQGVHRFRAARRDYLKSFPTSRRRT